MLSSYKSNKHIYTKNIFSIPVARNIFMDRYFNFAFNIKRSIIFNKTKIFENEHTRKIEATRNQVQAYHWKQQEIYKNYHVEINGVLSQITPILVKVISNAEIIKKSVFDIHHETDNLYTADITNLIYIIEKLKELSNLPNSPDKALSKIISILDNEEFDKASCNLVQGLNSVISTYIKDNMDKKPDNLKILIDLIADLKSIGMINKYAVSEKEKLDNNLKSLEKNLGYTISSMF